MVKRKKWTAWIMCAVVFLTMIATHGCGNKTPVSELIIDPSRDIPIATPEEGMGLFSAKEIALPALNGWDLGSITADDTFIYYDLSQWIPMGNSYTHSKIYRLDVPTGESTLLIDISNDGAPFFTNEMVCVGDYLFWVFRDWNETTIQKFSLKDHTLSTLMEYPAEQQPILLSGDDEYLTWFDSTDEQTTLYSYDTKTDEVSCLSNSIWMDSPYTRAFVCDGMTAFVEGTRTEKVLVLYDLSKQSRQGEYKLPRVFNFTRVQGNKEYVICADNYVQNTEIYLIDITSGQIKKLDWSDYEATIFSCHLSGEYVVINSSSYDELLVLSLKEHKLSVFPLKDSVLQGNVNANGMYYAYSYNQEKPIIQVLFLRGEAN